MCASGEIVAAYQPYIVAQSDQRLFQKLKLASISHSDTPALVRSQPKIVFKLSIIEQQLASVGVNYVRIWNNAMEIFEAGRHAILPTRKTGG
jgi:hypothetical protein